MKKPEDLEVVRLNEAHSPEVDLLCAVIGCAVEDVRFAKRNGYKNPDGTILRIGTQGGQKNAAFLFVQDAFDFFRDGRLERLCELINSKDLEPSRISAHVLNGVSLHRESGFRVVDGSKKGIPCEKELTVVEGGLKPNHR